MHDNNLDTKGEIREEIREDIINKYLTSELGHIRTSSSILEMTDIAKIQGHNKTPSISIISDKEKSPTISHFHNRMPSLIINNQQPTTEIKIASVTDNMLKNDEDDEILMGENKFNRKNIKKYVNIFCTRYFTGVCILILCLIFISIFAQLSNYISEITNSFHSLELLANKINNEIDFDAINNAFRQFPILVNSFNKINEINITAFNGAMQSFPLFINAMINITKINNKI